MEAEKSDVCFFSLTKTLFFASPQLVAQVKLQDFRNASARQIEKDQSDRIVFILCVNTKFKIIRRREVSDV